MHGINFNSGPPQSGVGQWIDIYFEATESFHTEESIQEVRWGLVDFYRGTEPLVMNWEKGTCSSFRSYAYFKMAPVGNYYSTIKFVNEFGDIVYCQEIYTYIKK